MSWLVKLTVIRFEVQSSRMGEKYFIIVESVHLEIIPSDRCKTVFTYYGDAVLSFVEFLLA